MACAVIELVGAERTYARDGVETHALRATNLTIGEGDLVAIVGRSGSGKSTFLNLITGIDRPTGGEVSVRDTCLNSLSESDLAEFRGRNIGIVFQFFELIPTLTALENVVLAMDLVGIIPAASRHERARYLLKQLGVADQGAKLPSRLSGGQQQRVAIARALANDPPILIADEPSGNLDSQNSAMVLEIFRSLAEQGRTVIIATHERAGIDIYDRVLEVVDGQFSEAAGLEPA